MTIRGTYRTLKIGITNIIKYIPIAWKDRDWDEAYIFDLLHFKLDKMAKYVDTYGWNADKGSVVRRLRVAAELSKRISEVTWIDRTLEKSVLLANHTFADKTETLLTNGNVLWEFKEQSASIKRRNKVRDSIAMKVTDYDKELLCKYIVKYSKGWWD